MMLELFFNLLTLEVYMQIQKTDNTYFKSFNLDKHGKEFLVSLYNHTEQNAHPFLTDELIKLKLEMTKYAQKMEAKNIDIIYTARPPMPSTNSSALPSLSLRTDGKSLKDAPDAPSNLLLLDLTYFTTQPKWSKSEVKTWFTRVQQEAKKWIILNYVDRFCDSKKPIEVLKSEIDKKPLTAEETINAIFG